MRRANHRNEPIGEVFRTFADLSDWVSREVREGRARKLRGRLYTTNLVETPEVIVNRNLWQVVSLLFPGAVVGHRTALEMRPTPGGTVFVSGPSARTVALPGLRVRMLKGPGRLDGDMPLPGSLWKASEARAYLECLQLRRIRGPESPGLPRAELERRLERVALRNEHALNQLRDAAREIAPELDAHESFAELDLIIGSLLGTRTGTLLAPTARSRALGQPYDAGRVQVFQRLLDALAQWPPKARPDSTRQGPEWENLAFFDAYFSNFIEGTEFRVDEAAQIVFEDIVPAQRPADAHDVRGTYELVSNPAEMGWSATRAAHDPDEFFAVLKRRHAAIMAGRPEKRPGEFKRIGNQTGSSYFVEPELVEGTLRQGFELFRSLAEPFHRAVFMLFLVAEVHPFDDGNGRTARAMMNAELTSGDQRRIIIPTVFRQGYVLSLKALTQTDRAEPVIRMLDRAQAFTASVDFTDYETALIALDEARAFDTTEDALLRYGSEA